MTSHEHKKINGHSGPSDDVWLVPLFILGLTFAIIFGLYQKSKSIWAVKGAKDVIFSTTWHPTQGEFGLGSFIAGTLWVTATAMMIAVPLGILEKVHIRKGKAMDFVVETYLRMIGLWNEVKDRLHGSASRLSIGQQQRLCLARALAVAPEVIFGDEPTSALDPLSSKNIERILLDLKKDYTIVLVTHLLPQAKRLADYVIFLYLGELIEHGPAREIFENPKHELMKEYIQGAIS